MNMPINLDNRLWEIKTILIMLYSKKPTISSDKNLSIANQMEHGETKTETSTGSPAMLEKTIASNTPVSQTKNGMKESNIGLKKQFKRKA